MTREEIAARVNEYLKETETLTALAVMEVWRRTFEDLEDKIREGQTAWEILRDAVLSVLKDIADEVTRVAIRRGMSQLLAAVSDGESAFKALGQGVSAMFARQRTEASKSSQAQQQANQQMLDGITKGVAAINPAFGMAISGVMALFGIWKAQEEARRRRMEENFRAMQKEISLAREEADIQARTDRERLAAIREEIRGHEELYEYAGRFGDAEERRREIELDILRLRKEERELMMEMHERAMDYLEWHITTLAKLRGIEEDELEVRAAIAEMRARELEKAIELELEEAEILDRAREFVDVIVDAVEDYRTLAAEGKVTREDIEAMQDILRLIDSTLRDLPSLEAQTEAEKALKDLQIIRELLPELGVEVGRIDFAQLGEALREAIEAAPREIELRPEIRPITFDFSFLFEGVIPADTEFWEELCETRIAPAMRQTAISLIGAER
jgi:tetratricopeptide (TPR) repeat protein